MSGDRVHLPNSEISYIELSDLELKPPEFLVPKLNQSQPFRLLVAAVVIAVCIGLMKTAATFGLSKILTTYSIRANSIEAANTAVQLTPSDPEAHRARAAILNNLGLTADALKEIEVAVGLRPQDDYLWLEVGALRDGNGDRNSALTAFDNAVKFAPHYGHTHWQRGNLLVRMGRYDEGFDELRRAAARNPNFLPGLIDLAWGISRGDAQLIEQLVQPQNDRTRLVLARFLANHGKGAEAAGHVRNISTTIPEEARNDLIRSLVHAKSYSEAFELWKAGRSNTTISSPIQNGSFEEELILNEIGFGWQALQDDKVVFALDVNRPFDGSRSLRITFEGYGNQTPVLSQLMLVKPQQAYRISFAVKTRDMITGGLPLLTVIDANTGEILEKSSNFKPNEGDAWTRMSFDLNTAPTSKAVYLRLERTACSSSPCPIFGQLWLDSFQVEEISAN